MPLAPLLAAEVAEHGQAGISDQPCVHRVHIVYLNVEEQPGNGSLPEGRHAGVTRINDGKLKLWCYTVA